MTVEARKGNDGVVRNDFEAAVQTSYEQGAGCYKLLRPDHLFLNESAQPITLRHPFVETFIVCLVSDHYPALNQQTRMLLRTDARVPTPLVIDVFALDLMTEFLNHPLYFLSYLSRRAAYSNRTFFAHETAILGYHLKTNLWVEDDFDLVTYADAMSQEMDTAMEARRLGSSAAKTPTGILTRIPPTTVGWLLDKIAASPRRNMIDFGLAALMMDEDRLVQLSRSIDEAIERARCDGKPHDCTQAFTTWGITVHCNSAMVSSALRYLHSRCEKWKTDRGADVWFGLCISPTKELRFAIKLGQARRTTKRALQD